MNVGTLVTRHGVPALLVLSLVGCKTWEPVQTSPQRMMTDVRPSSVRVTDIDGAMVTLKSPMLVNDSLVSGAAPPPGAVVVPPRVGVLADDVASMEVARFSAARSIVLAGAIAAASIGWARVQSSAGGGEDRPGPLPKDSALSLTRVWSLLWGLF